MNEKYINLFWGISLMVISIGTLILSVCNILGAALPDIAVRIIGITDLILLPVLIFTTLKKVKK